MIAAGSIQEPSRQQPARQRPGAGQRILTHQELQRENERLRKENERLRKKIAESEKQLAESEKQIAELERQLAGRMKDSTNSSKAPVLGRPRRGAAQETSPQMRQAQARRTTRASWKASPIGAARARRSSHSRTACRLQPLWPRLAATARSGSRAGECSPPSGHRIAAGEGAHHRVSMS